MQITIDQDSESIERGYTNYMSEVLINDYFCTRSVYKFNMEYSYGTYHHTNISMYTSNVLIYEIF